MRHVTRQARNFMAFLCGLSDQPDSNALSRVHRIAPRNRPLALATL